MNRRPFRLNPLARRAESGQALVIFAIMFMVMLAFLAIGIDLSLIVGGQRRFDQNGADSGVIAVGELIAGSVRPLPSYNTDGRVYFGLDDEYVYATARRLGGLPARLDAQGLPVAADWTSANPTGVNQNIRLTTRNKLAVTLEYWGTNEWGAAWCYSPSSPMPDRVGGMPRCSLVDSDGNGRLNVPEPDIKIPFKARVTVSSTVTGFFANVVGLGNGRPARPAPTDDRAAACNTPQSGVKSGGTWTWTPLPASLAPGRTTCAHAVIAIRGSTRLDTGAPVIPVTTGACQLANPAGPPLLTLWGGAGQTEDCSSLTGSQLNSYGNILDLTADQYWCDTASPNYPFVGLMPAGAASTAVLGSNCVQDTTGPGGTDTWNRGAFVPDNTNRNALMPGYPQQNSVRDNDMTWWVARGFGGGDVGAGQWFPTYCHAEPEGQQQNCSTQGNNVAAAIYCTSGDARANPVWWTGNGTLGPAWVTCVPPNGPNPLNGTGTYFFANGQPNFHNVCPAPDPYGVTFGFGCRDVGIPIWDDAAVANSSPGTSWIDSGGMIPDRMKIRQILTFRLYCAHDNAGLCTRAPNVQITTPNGTFNYAGGNSRVYGSFVSNSIPGSSCLVNNDCAPGVTLNGNYSTLER